MYAGATYLMYLQFPETYPEHPPEVRFQTQIRHCNVNAHGKVCHGVLGRDWSPTTQVHEILSHVYGLLLIPETDAALDSSLANLFHTDMAAYLDAVRPSAEALSLDREARCERLSAPPAESKGGAAGSLPSKRVQVCARPSCGSDGELRCARCKRAKYCGKSCQRAHWSTHKRTCVAKAPSARPPEKG